MSENKIPADWDEQKVRRVVALYEEQTEEDALAEDEAGIQPSDIPDELHVARVRNRCGHQRGKL